MKNILVITSISGLLIFAACTKKNEPAASMTATVNGAAFFTLGPGVKTSGAGPRHLMTIIGTNSPENGSPVATSIGIVVYDSVNTYEINSAAGAGKGVAATFSSAATGGLSMTATSGSVTVTNSNGSYFQGTFNLTFADSLGTYSVTNGQFTGTY